MKIPLAKPLIDAEDFKAVQAPLESGWLVQGPWVKQFEDRVAQYCGVRHAVAASSCTTALHLALVAAGIGPGDNVLVPSFTYVATANAVEHAGARPVFLDTDPITFNISIEHLRGYLETCESNNQSMPKAIIPVHLFGLCADMPEISKLAEKYSLIVIEDAACALGSKIQEKPAGRFGIAACFSFHPRKLITTGEGGMIVTQDETIANNLRILRDHGADISDHLRHLERKLEMPDFNHLGYNYRMTDIQGALGVSQMAKLYRILETRKKLAEFYHRMLEKIPWLQPPACPEGFVHTYQSYVCRLEIKNQLSEELGSIRNALMTYLSKAEIATRPGTHAVHQLGYYRKKYGLASDHCPNSWLAHNNTLTLPLYPGMTDADQERIVEAIARFQF